MKIKVYIQPSSKKYGYAGMYNNIPKIKITAPPVDGAANSEVIKIFSKILNLPKSNIIISQGQASRVKTIDINMENITYDDILLKIQAFK